ncbi:hypothetical protein DHEL01_v210187 [Diaporthe helianthi]|uniref:Uncharacterized protein n=1 Tax=Diaporthe helianthi TaxID=158607 RepID=A0A2P5HMG9_DIAHE|nr:hypothetical protein DHEL01_v210187 [Diaporthe helianthi]
MQDLMPSFLISTKLKRKRTNTSHNSTTKSSQTTSMSMMESKATVHPVSVLDNQEYYQVPVMIPETVIEKPEQLAIMDNWACQERDGLGPTPRVEDIEDLAWDIWAGPTADIPNLPKPPPAVYPGDENIQDNPNLRFLTVHHLV